MMMSIAAGSTPMARRFSGSLPRFRSAACACPEPASLRISLPRWRIRNAVDVERQRLAVGHAGQPRAVLLVDAEDDVVVAVQHAVGDGGDGEFADLSWCVMPRAASAGLPRIMSEAFSAIISTQALMCAETRSGIAEASTTRSRSTPCTRNCGSTTALGPMPIAQVEAGWCAVIAVFLIQASISASVLTSGPGEVSAPRNGASGACAATSRAILKPCAQGRQVVRRAEVARDDLHRIVRIGRAQQHLAAAVGMQQRRPDAEAVRVGPLPAREPERGLGRRAAEHELDVGHRKLRPRLDEGVQAARHHGRRPAAEEVAAQHVQRHLVEPHVVAEFAATGPREHDQHREMVLQIFADRQIGDRLDADRAQMIGRADAGQHQQLRRIERAAAQDHLAIGHGA